MIKSHALLYIGEVTFKDLGKLPETLFCFDLNKRPLSQSLSNAFKISKKTWGVQEIQDLQKLYEIHWLIIEIDLSRNYPDEKSQIGLHLAGYLRLNKSRDIWGLVFPIFYRILVKRNSTKTYFTNCSTSILKIGVTPASSTYQGKWEYF